MFSFEIHSKVKNFRDLIEQLNDVGFNVDHFHAVGIMPLFESEMRSRGDTQTPQECLFAVKDGVISFYLDYVEHYNFFRDEEGKVQEYVEGELNMDPHKYAKIICDERHPR